MAQSLAFFIIVLIASYFLFALIEAHFDTQFNGLTEHEAREKHKIQNTLSVSFAIMETITSAVCAIAFATILSLNLGFIYLTMCLIPILEVIVLRFSQLVASTSKKWILIRLGIYIISIFIAALIAIHICSLIQAMI